MIDKLINYYVQLYVKNDNDKKIPRIEHRRIAFLIINLGAIWGTGIVFTGLFINLIYNLFLGGK